MSKAKLYTALSKAQNEIDAVFKKVTNPAYQKPYVTMDQLVAAGAEVLAKYGLSLIPTRFERVDVDQQLLGKADQDGAAMHRGCYARRYFVLAHESGEEIEIGPIDWPAIPQKGRAPEFAWPMASTMSLGYFFRDLLMIPRFSEHEYKQLQVENRRYEQQAMAEAASAAAAREKEERDRIEAAKKAAEVEKDAKNVIAETDKATKALTTPIVVTEPAKPKNVIAIPPNEDTIRRETVAQQAQSEGEKIKDEAVKLLTGEVKHDPPPPLAAPPPTTDVKPPIGMGADQTAAVPPSQVHAMKSTPVAQPTVSSSAVLDSQRTRICNRIVEVWITHKQENGLDTEEKARAGRPAFQKSLIEVAGANFYNEKNNLVPAMLNNDMIKKLDAHFDAIKKTVGATA